MFIYNEETATPEGEFTNGDPIIGVPRTIFRASWPNMIQREILNVLLAGSIEADQDAYDQLALAIQALVDIGVNNANGFTNQSFIGQIRSGPYATTPTGWLLMDGSLHGRSTYPQLWTYINAYYTKVVDSIRVSNPGSFTDGDGSSTFRLPDMRGLFVRGQGGKSSGVGQLQADAIRDITGRFRSVDRSNPFHTGAFTEHDRWSVEVAGGAGDNWGVDYQFRASDSGVPTANENRPENVAWRYIIRAE